jgi:hypothetical protein
MGDYSVHEGLRSRAQRAGNRAIGFIALIGNGFDLIGLDLSTSR